MICNWRAQVLPRIDASMLKLSICREFVFVITLQNLLPFFLMLLFAAAGFGGNGPHLKHPHCRVITPREAVTPGLSAKPVVRLCFSCVRVHCQPVPPTFLSKKVRRKRPHISPICLPLVWPPGFFFARLCPSATELDDELELLLLLRASSVLLLVLLLAGPCLSFCL